MAHGPLDLVPSLSTPTYEKCARLVECISMSMIPVMIAMMISYKGKTKTLMVGTTHILAVQVYVWTPTRVSNIYIPTSVSFG